MGYVTKCPTISFVNLFSPPPTHTHTRAQAILLLSSATSCASFHASAASWQVERTQAAEGPAAHHMDQMKSERLRRYGLLMEDWLVTTGVLGGCGEGKRCAHAPWGAPAFFKASLKLRKKEEKKHPKSDRKIILARSFIYQSSPAPSNSTHIFFPPFPIKVSVCNNKTAYSLKSCLSEFHWLTGESPH